MTEPTDIALARGAAPPWPTPPHPEWDEPDAADEPGAEVAAFYGDSDPLPRFSVRPRFPIERILGLAISAAVWACAASVWGAMADAAAPGTLWSAVSAAASTGFMMAAFGFAILAAATLAFHALRALFDIRPAR